MNYFLRGLVLCLLMQVCAAAKMQFWVGTATRNGESLSIQVRLNDDKPATACACRMKRRRRSRTRPMFRATGTQWRRG